MCMVSGKREDVCMHEYTYAYNDQVDEAVISLIGAIPKRWGRMNPLSRLLIVEVGRLLIAKGLITSGQKCSDRGLTIGLVGATSRGSLRTDVDFIASMEEGAGLASPALFGYTLPNIPLAEAAGQFGLTGPVYALFDTLKPFEKAELEARYLLSYHSELSLMLACEFDHLSGREARGGVEKLLVNLTIVEK
ncbi:MAG: hypothetical protein COA36_02320 [Desulfotalea sp.]|nr:MAG: hypothetical protein COA36_02320 [Desulfotalea sp.]